MSISTNETLVRQVEELAARYDEQARKLRLSGSNSGWIAAGEKANYAAGLRRALSILAREP